jgi:hypothetical protein
LRSDNKVQGIAETFKGSRFGAYSHRIKYARVDADTGEEVAAEDIMKGFKVDTDTYVEAIKEELENVALESTRTIEVDEFSGTKLIPGTSSVPTICVRTRKPLQRNPFFTIRSHVNGGLRTMPT